MKYSPLPILLAMDAVVLFLLGLLLILEPTQVELAFHFKDLPGGVSYISDLWQGLSLAIMMNSTPLPPPATEQLRKSTASRCPVCRKACPADVWRVEGRPAKVFLRRRCPEHGEASVCIASDARFYWLATG